MPATKAISKEILPLVEKPKVEEAPFNLTVVSRYVPDKQIWPLLENTPLGVGVEMQLTDAIAMPMEQQSVEAFCMTGLSHDCGDKLGYMKANVEYTMCHTAFGEDFKSRLRALLDCDDNSANI